MMKSAQEISTMMKAGIVPAIPKKGETSSEAVKRVQKKNPGRKVVDPPAPTGTAVRKQYKKRGLFKPYNIYRSAYIRLPMPESFVFDDEYDDYTYKLSRMGQIPEEWQESSAITRYRVDSTRVHRGFSLYGVHSNKLTETHNIGRTWSAEYPGEFSFVRGHVWGDIELVLEPAFAGLEEEAAEKTAFAALSNLPHSFGGAKVGEFHAHSRYSLRDLINREFNCVRYLWRLAVLWITAKCVELDGGMLEVTGVSGAPETKFIKTIGEFSNMLTAAAEGNAQVVYTELNRISAEESLIEIYYLAACMTPSMRARGGGSLPTVSKAWPEIQNMYLGVYGRTEVAMRIGIIDSQTIWTALEHYVRLYGVQEEMGEVFDALKLFMSRPDGDTVLCGHEAISLALPESNMSAAGVGPLASSVRNWEKKCRSMHEPHFKDYLWEGATRYGAWALAYRDVCATVGGNAAMSRAKVEPEAIKHGELLAWSSIALNALQILVEQYMQNYGWENGLGRVGVTVRGMTKVRTHNNGLSALAVPLCHVGAVQWEEFLPYTKKIPDTAFISSMLYPACPKASLPINTWISANGVENRTSDVYAYNSMAALRLGEFGLVTYSAYTQMLKAGRKPLIMNYRNEVADAQFTDLVPASGVVIKPAFRYRNNRDALSCWAEAQRRTNFEWFIDSAYDESFDGLLAHFKELDAELYGAAGKGRGDDYFAEAGSDEEVGMLEEVHAAQEVERVTEAIKSRSAKTVAEESVPKGVIEREMYRKPMPKPWEVRREAILNILGEGMEVPWLDCIVSIRNRVGPNPVTQQELNRVDGQKALQALREVDIRLMPCFCTNQDQTGQLMTLVANSLEDLIPHVPPGSCQTDIYKMAQASRVMGASLKASGGITNAETYKALTRRELPAHVTNDQFDAAVMAGIPAGEIVNTADAYHLESLIDRQAKALEEDVAAAVAEGRFGICPEPYETYAGPQRTPSPQPREERSKIEVEIEAELKERLSKVRDGVAPELLETDEPEREQLKETVLSTGEGEVLLEAIDESVPDPNFGGAASSVVAGDTGPVEGEQPASSAAAQPVVRSSSVAFTAKPLPEQPDT